MMERNLVSVIIPVYNVQEYLLKCVESVINQTYANIEIILIDDGSKDKSGEICDKLAERDQRIRVIHTENKGVSTARNTGLSIAVGEYVTFVDSDDTVNEKFVEELYAAFDSSVDMTVCAFNRVDKDGNIKSIQGKEGVLCVLDREEALETMFYGKLFAGHSWNKMFKKAKLNNLMFRTDIAVYEDLLFCSEYLLKSDKVKYIPNPLYDYYDREGSALHGKMSEAKLTAFKALDIIDSGLKNTYDEKFIALTNYCRMVWALDCFRILCFDKENRKRYQNILIEIIRKYKNNHYLSKKMKTKILMLLVTPKLFYFSYEIFRN